MFQYNEIEVKQALHPLKRRGLPYNYDLNIYRGCGHNCQYCYAKKSHQYLQSSNLAEEVFVKVNIANLLDRQLSVSTWKGETINLGGVCDSYQPIEATYQLMPEVLKVLIKHKNPIVISTKSDLILRDIALIEELAHHTTVQIAMCITSINDEVSKNVEPGASLPVDRLKALTELSKTKAITGLHTFPILPFLADDEETLETLVRWTAESNASYMMPAMLYMTGGIKKNYMTFIKSIYPKHYADYLRIYQKGSADKEYKSKIHGCIKRMREKYHVKTRSESS